MKREAFKRIGHLCFKVKFPQQFPSSVISADNKMITEGVTGWIMIYDQKIRCNHFGKKLSIEAEGNFARVFFYTREDPDGRQRDRRTIPGKG